mmetsp:Transcript_130128/g.417556  ORF Transcript_130128/g.417556 Transcript_130128/m.417556 type:complete len:590 (+) Transcript_130128:260-2029(+)
MAAVAAAAAGGTGGGGAVGMAGEQPASSRHCAPEPSARGGVPADEDPGRRYEGLQHLPHELLADIGEHYLDAPVWHACKLGEVSPHMGKVFRDDALWEKFFRRRFDEASRSAKRRTSAAAAWEPTSPAERSASPTGTSARGAYAQLHELEARFRGGQYGARGVLNNPHQGVAVLDLQVASTDEDSVVAFAALRNGAIMAYHLDPDSLSRSGRADGIDPEGSRCESSPSHATPLCELTPQNGNGGPALCCLPIRREHGFGDAASSTSPMLVAGYALGCLSAWQLPEGRPFVPRGWESAHGGRVCALARLGSGELLSAASDGALKAWALDGERCGELQRAFPGHVGAVVSVAASPHDRNMLLSGSHDRTVRLWDARAPGEAVARWRQQDWVTCVDFHPTEATHVLSSDKAVHRWDLRRIHSNGGTTVGNATEAFVHMHLSTSHRHRKLVSRFRVDPLRLASCSLDGSVKVSSLEAPGLRIASPLASPETSPSLGPSQDPGLQEVTLRTSTDYVLCIDFDATRLLVGGIDGRVDVYDFSCPNHFRHASPVLGSRAAPGVALAEALAVARQGGRCRDESEGGEVVMVMEEIEL